MMELRNKTVTCLVSLPDSVVFAVDVDRNAEGSDVLTKVCNDLHILEVDFFGLVYNGLDGEDLWLNLRNRIASELSGSPPYRLQLRLKFFVKPHFIQQETTRNQVFVNAKQQFLSGKLRFTSDDRIVLPSALLFLIYQRDLTKSFGSSSDCDQFLPTGYQSVKYRNLVTNQCAMLGTLSEESAKSRFVEAASLSPFYGIHLHKARDDAGRDIRVGVGRDGITEYGKDWKLSGSWNWSTVQSATHDALHVIVNTVQDDGVAVTHSLKLPNKTAASALYRDMTEIHSFYHCDSIGSVVTEQYCRDLKGTIVSFFNENTCLGKKYVFDIQRTLRESYDYVRRILYSSETKNCLVSPSVENSTSSSFIIPDLRHSCSSTCQALHQLNDIRESLICRICVDVDMDTAFVPCGHIVCCAACAKRLDCCPVCKTAIELAQPIFLPYVQPMISAATESLTVTCT